MRSWWDSFLTLARQRKNASFFELTMFSALGNYSISILFKWPQRFFGSVNERREMGDGSSVTMSIYIALEIKKF